MRIVSCTYVITYKRVISSQFSNSNASNMYTDHDRVMMVVLMTVQFDVTNILSQQCTLAMY